MTKYHISGLLILERKSRKIFFVDPFKLNIISLSIEFHVLLHGLVIDADRGLAFISALREAHQRRPSTRLVSIFDLGTRSWLTDIDLGPLKAPRAMRFGPDGLLYVCCGDSAAIAVIDPEKKRVRKVFPTLSAQSRGLTILPERQLIVTENGADATLSVIRLADDADTRMISCPGGTAGMDRLPDEKFLVVTSAQKPSLFLMDVDAGEVRQEIMLPYHQEGAQSVCLSPNGQWLLVIGGTEAIVTLISLPQWNQYPVGVGEKPSEAVFRPDGRTVIVTYENSEMLTEIDLSSRTVMRTVKLGVGCDAIAFF